MTYLTRFAARMLRDRDDEPDERTPVSAAVCSQCHGRAFGAGPNDTSWGCGACNGTGRAVAEREL